jgi:hypothetical protein
MAVGRKESVVRSGRQMLQCQIAGRQQIQMAKTGIDGCFQLLLDYFNYNIFTNFLKTIFRVPKCCFCPTDEKFFLNIQMSICFVSR